MERVLVTGASNIGKAGVASMVYKWGQAFDDKNLIYDYLMQSGLPKTEYIENITKKGGKIHTLIGRKKSPIGIIKWVTQVIKKGSYNILHINSDSAYIAAAYIYAAKKANINKILVHSHCTQIDDNNFVRRTIKTLLHKMCIPYVLANSDHYLACSGLAGEWMFGSKGINSGKYKLIYNGVEVSNYLFDPNKRMCMRKKLKLEDSIVIGNIGRFSYQKNHKKLLDIFLDFIKEYPNSILLLVGEGELEDSIRNKVKQLNLHEKVRFLGLRNDIPDLLNAMDIMVMPSMFEGLPVTMIEAQMASLPCVVSDVITQEVNFSNKVSFVSLNDKEVWVNTIIENLEIKREGESQELYDSMFNIKRAAEELSNVLLS